MTQAMIAGRPVEEWERIMDDAAFHWQTQGFGDIAGVTVRDYRRDDQCGRFSVTAGDIPNDVRGIRPDGTRIESAHLVRAGVYGDFPGKWATPKDKKSP